MTETLSLISVVVMALLLWREHRAHVRTGAELETIRARFAGLEEYYDRLGRTHYDTCAKLDEAICKIRRMTERPRGPRGFVKRGNGRAL